MLKKSLRLLYQRCGSKYLLKVEHLSYGHPFDEFRQYGGHKDSIAQRKNLHGYNIRYVDKVLMIKSQKHIERLYLTNSSRDPGAYCVYLADDGEIICTNRKQFKDIVSLVKLYNDLHTHNRILEEDFLTKNKLKKEWCETYKRNEQPWNGVWELFYNILSFDVF